MRNAYGYKVVEIWSMTRALSVSVRSLCSHTRSTRMPFALSSRVTRRARFLLPSIFDLQYLRFPFGSRRHRGHPCQKHPSTKRATRCLGNQKSGWPGIVRACRCHPFTPAFTNANRRRRSVDRFPLERTIAIKALRSGLVRMSINNSLDSRELCENSL